MYFLDLYLWLSESKEHRSQADDKKKIDFKKYYWFIFNSVVLLNMVKASKTGYLLF